MSPFSAANDPQSAQSNLLRWPASRQNVLFRCARMPGIWLACALLLVGFLPGCQPSQAAQEPPNLPATSLAEFVGSTATSLVSPTRPADPTPSPTLRPPRPTQTSRPSPTDPAQACLQEPGQIVHQSLRSLQLKLPMEIRVYLPGCYDVLPDRRFPVLYLIHGMNNTEEQWEKLGVGEAADRLIRTRQAVPFIIIMPHDRLWKEPSETPFDEVFIDELVPWVDENYRTLADRQHRAVGGLSRGGMWALHFGIGNWELFGAVGLHSSPVFWEDARALGGWLEAIPTEQLPRLYLDIGEKDYLMTSNQWLVNTLNKKNIPHEYYLYPGYHEDAYWAAHVEEYLRWYTSVW